MIFCERLKYIREKREMSQSALARFIRITASAISQMEDGTTKRASSENIFSLARALQVNPEWLATGEGEETSGVDTTLSPDEAALLRKYHMMDERQKAALRAVADGMLPE